MLAMAGGALVTASTLPLVDFFGRGDRYHLCPAGGALTGWILTGVGYEPSVEQTATALNGILFNLAGSQVLAGFVVLACLAFYKLNKQWAEQNA